MKLVRSISWATALIVLGVLGWLGVLAWRWVSGQLNPVLIIRESPGCRVQLDGRDVRFERGTYHFSPSKPVYRLDIACGTRRETVELYPFRGAADSPSVVVSEEGTVYYIEHRAIAPYAEPR